MIRMDRYFLLKNLHQEIYNILIEAEEKLYTSCDISMIRCRQAIEAFVNSIYKKENIRQEDRKTLDEKLIELLNRGILVPEIYDSMDFIRRKGNVTLHEMSKEFKDAEKCIENSVQITIWFAMRYMDINIEEISKFSLGDSDKLLCYKYITENNRSSKNDKECQR